MIDIENCELDTFCYDEDDRLRNHVIIYRISDMAKFKGLKFNDVPQVKATAKGIISPSVSELYIANILVGLQIKVPRRKDVKVIKKPGMLIIKTKEVPKDYKFPASEVAELYTSSSKPQVHIVGAPNEGHWIFFRSFTSDKDMMLPIEGFHNPASR